MRHPHFDAEYESVDDELVLVRDFTTGREGVFDRDGCRVSGDLRWADPHLARWVCEQHRPQRK